MNNIKEMLGSNPFGEEAFNLWKEYASDSTPEAKFVKDLDKLELIIQAIEYEKRKKKEMRYLIYLLNPIMFRGRNQFREMDYEFKG